MAAKKRRKKGRRKGKRRTAAQRAATKRLIAMNKKKGKKTKRKSKRRRKKSPAQHMRSATRAGLSYQDKATAFGRGYKLPGKKKRRRKSSAKGQAVTLRSLLGKTRGRRSVLYICGGGKVRTGCGGGSRGGNRVKGILR